MTYKQALELIIQLAEDGFAPDATEPYLMGMKAGHKMAMDTCLMVANFALDTNED